MQHILEKLNELDSGEVGLVIFSVLEGDIVCSFNQKMSVPLASAAKVAIAFCLTKLVEERHYAWNDLVNDISFNPNEDSNEIYPHFQDRVTLSLQEAVEVMIACHDSFVANRIVEHIGGWDKLNRKLKSYFNNINITKNPRDFHNVGELSQLMEILRIIFQGYKNKPNLWFPVMNGLVRQRGEVTGIPIHLLNHMTGGLDNALIDMGIIGEFSKSPFLYVLGAKELPDRKNNKIADNKIIEVLNLLYEKYYILEKVK